MEAWTKDPSDGNEIFNRYDAILSIDFEINSAIVKDGAVAIYGNAGNKKYAGGCLKLHCSGVKLF